MVKSTLNAWIWPPQRPTVCSRPTGAQPVPGRRRAALGDQSGDDGLCLRHDTDSLREFQTQLARAHSLVPVTRVVAADLETPVSAFLKRGRGGARSLPAGIGRRRRARIGRYTFIGIRPYKKMTARDGQITITEGRQKAAGPIPATSSPSSKAALRRRNPGPPPRPAAFHRRRGRLLQLRRRPLHRDAAFHSLSTNSTSPTPTSCSSTKSSPSTTSRKPSTSSSPSAPAEGRRRRVRPEPDTPPRPPRKASERGHSPSPKGLKQVNSPLKLTSRTRRAAFLRSVERGERTTSRAGDVFQCVLSQRFDCEPGVDAFEIYRSLRIVNPSPYLYFLKFGLEDAARGSTSPARRISLALPARPEMLVRVHNGKVEYRPIAGSRPRGKDEVEDRALRSRSSAPTPRKSPSTSCWSTSAATT